MSVPSPFSQQRGNSDTREDCRDYLRTGRCKYGASCKYNHPPNVQSGGGMKAPLDPSEPMFPVRPKEPLCQYYMKHGTCKFGQACKFHHPPQSPAHTATLVGTTGTVQGAVVTMNLGRNLNSDTPMIINTVGTDASTGSPFVLQFLPQRPDEPDCIFFLKNGRCKYGATCRYHHPVNFHQRRQDDIRGQQQRVHHDMLPSKLQFLAQPMQHNNAFQQSNVSGGTHQVVTADGCVGYVTLDSNGMPQGTYHQLSVGNDGAGYCTPLGLPLSVNHEHASSSSSIASSYGTANSNLQQLDTGDNTESSGAGLWNRSTKSAHSNALNVNAYPKESHASGSGTRQPGGLGPRVMTGPAKAEGNISSRRLRAASYGSASDSSVYADASAGPRSRPNGTLPSNAVSSANSATRTWRGPERASSNYETSRRPHANNYNAHGPADGEGDMSDHGQHHKSVNVRRSGVENVRPPVFRNSDRQKHPRGAHSSAVDDGLNMMTSALLTMLDTPEEAPTDSFEQSSENESNSNDGSYNASSSNRGALSQERMEDNSRRGAVPYCDNGNNMSRNGYPLQGPSENLDQEIFARINLHPRGSTDEVPMYHQEPTGYRHDGGARLVGTTATGDESPGWYPTWHTFDPPSHHHHVVVGSPMESNAQSMSVIQPRHAAAAASSSTHAASNIGLFLS